LVSKRLTRLPPHPPVNRHAGHPQWEMVLRLTRCTLGARAGLVEDFTEEEVEWMAIEAATRYFDAVEANRRRAVTIN
jgi:hypothetical protein